MGPQTPFYFETDHCCQPQMAGMDHGAWENLKTQGGLQECFYLESLGKKKKKKGEKEKLLTKDNANPLNRKLCWYTLASSFPPEVV